MKTLFIQFGETVCQQDIDSFVSQFDNARKVLWRSYCISFEPRLPSLDVAELVRRSFPHGDYAYGYGSFAHSRPHGYD